MHYVYSLIDPDTNKLRYIGYSCNPKRRYREHINHRNRYLSRNNNWIKRLVGEGKKPIMRIIGIYDTVTEGLKQESYWIRYFKKKGCSINNHDEGSTGVKGIGLSENTKKNISNSVKQYYKNNPKKDEEMREMFHKNCHKGKPMSADNKKKLIEANIVPIICNELNKTYKSITEAARDLNVHTANICKVLKGLRKTTGGYTFSYMEVEYFVSS